MQNNKGTTAENTHSDYSKCINAYNRTLIVTDDVCAFVCDAGIWITDSG